MMYQVTENEQGLYFCAKDGKSYDLLACNKATGPKGVNAGWKEYKTLKNALKGFGLKEKNPGKV